MLSRLVLAPPILSRTLFQTNIKHVNQRSSQIIRQFQNDSRSGFTKSRADRINEKITERKTTLREKIMAPAGPNAFALGKGALAGGSALALGALCYYGIGLGEGSNALQQSIAWPEYVKERIHSTYAYFGGSIIVTAASALAVFRTPALINLVARSGWIPLLVSMGAMMASGAVARSIPYESGFGTKQMAWLAHVGIIGAVIAPICFIGGPILVRAAWYTAGVVGGLSTLAVCAPSDKFLYMGGPLAIGLGAVFASSLCSMFLPPTTALGAGLYSMSLYGGLLLFGAFLLYDTQRIVHMAENHPRYGTRPFDPINAATSIYLDTLNIFLRIVSILSGGGGNRRK